MAVGSFSYGEFGLTPIDTYSSSTSVSNIDIDVNDTSENNTLVLVQGTLQVDSNNVSIYIQWLNSSNAVQNGAYRSVINGTTSTLINNNSSNQSLCYYTAGNSNRTSYDPVTVGSACKMLDFEMLISSERSSSAPIRNTFAVVWGGYYTTGEHFFTPIMGTRCIIDTPITSVRLKASSGTVTGAIKSYSLFAKT